jgi:hypothetical protein
MSEDAVGGNTQTSLDTKHLNLGASYSDSGDSATARVSIVSTQSRNVPFFGLLFVHGWPCPKRSPAEPEGRSVSGEAERKANHGRVATPAVFESRFCISPRTASRQGWCVGGTHFRLARCSLECFPAGFSPTFGRAGAGISRYGSARPRYSMAMLPCRPSHTSTRPSAGAYARLSNWKNRFSYLTTQSWLIPCSLSNRFSLSPDHFGSLT